MLSSTPPPPPSASEHMHAPTHPRPSERSALVARDPDVGETDGPGIELTEPAPRPPRAWAVRATPLAIPPELSVVAIAEATASSSSLQP